GRLRLPDRPRAVAQLTIAGGNLVLDGSTTRPSEVSQRAIARLEWRQRDSGPEAIAGLPSSGERVTLPLPKAAGEYHIVLRATDAGGQIDESTAILRIRNKRATVFDPMREHANWVDDAVVYTRSEEHTSELQSRENLVCRLLLEKKKYDSKRTRH